MRVTYLSAVGALGGAERCLIDMARLTHELGIGCSAVLLDDGPLADELRSARIEVIVERLPAELSTLGDSNPASAAATIGRLAFSSPRLVPFIRKLRAMIASTNPSIVHSNGFKTHLLSRFVAPRPSRLIWHMHDFVGGRKLMRLALRAAARRPVEIVAVSRAVAEDVAKVCPQATVTCVYNAIDCNVFSPGTMPHGWLESAAGVAPPESHDAVNVGLVATYARWKGHEVFIRAIAQLPANVREQSRFYIVGGPIYRTRGSQYQEAELRELAKAVAAKVVFVPFQRNPAEVFKALDIVVHASTAPEPFGRTIVEAMATGRAAIVAPVGGAAELFEPGVNAIAANSQADLAASIQRLVSDESMRRSLGAHARNHALARFSLPRLQQELRNLYAATKRPDT